MRMEGIYPLKDCTHIFIAALCVIVKNWKRLTYPLTDKWINKFCFGYTVKYYSAIKRDRLLIHATTWIDLKIIILSERIQTKIIHTIIYINDCIYIKLWEIQTNLYKQTTVFA